MMTNLEGFRRACRPRCPSSPDAIKAADFDIELAFPNAASTASTVEEIPRFILDFTTQRILHPAALQSLIAQIETIGRLLQLASTWH